MKRICVIGSLNIDIVTATQRLPAPGETLAGNRFDVFMGGKGANQAVALGKLGADVRLVGKLGDRFYSAEYLETLKRYRVQCDTVQLENDSYPGTAVITVDSRGENTILIHPGANQRVDISFIDEHWEKIAANDIVLLQCEIPYETNLYVAKKLKGLGRTVILDPAPAEALEETIFPYVDFLTPNEVELQTLAGETDHGRAGMTRAARQLLQKGVGIVIAKAGREGCYSISLNETVHVPAFTMDVVDTTAAGDSFNAGFAFGLAKGMEIKESLRLANAVAGLSTTAMGAQTAMPSWGQVEEVLKREEFE